MPGDALGPDPAVHKRRLRSELRKAREAVGMTQREVAAAMDWSASKLIRIETGAVNISTNDLRALLAHYGADQARIDVLVEVARAAREQPRWSLYRDVAGPEYIAFLGYESSASVIRNFEPMVVPGLLQTEEYTRELLRVTTDQDINKVDLDPLVDLRMQRQELLVRESAPPKFNFIMDEAVIRRIVGSRDIMRRQLRHLRDIADRSNITIRIVPFEEGFYPRFRIPYVLFEFPDPEDEDVLYVEDPLGQLLIRENTPEERGNITPINYLGFFWSIEQLTPRENANIMIEDALATLAD